jgi:hypothetical protein
MTLARTLIIGLTSITLLISGCSGGGDKEKDTRGDLKVTVTDSETVDALADVRVLVFDANTNLPVGDALETDADGVATEKYEPGTYYLKLSKQDYEPSPAKNVAALPLSVATGEMTETEVVLFSTGDTGGGVISGQVTDGTDAVAGVLVVATNTSDAEAFSSITDESGYYIIHNAPATTYRVKAWIGGYDSDEVGATVVQAMETTDINLTLTAGAAGVVGGAVSFLATDNGEVDVSLIHPVSRDVIPGTSTRTMDMLYSISNVPAGSYIARATFENDNYVGDNVDRPFSVTGSVTLTSPTNTSTDTVPAVVDTLIPTFTWVAYSSANDYVVEVVNASGKVIWGGFSDDWATKNYSVLADQTSVVFNEDGTATEDLVDGKTYRWRIYASKDCNGNQCVNPFTLISSSEDQMGLFKVVLPAAAP